MQKLEERISRLDEILNVPNNFLKYEQLNLLSTIHKLEEIFTNFTQQTDCHDFQIKKKTFEELHSSWAENPTLKLSPKDKLKVLSISEDFIENIEGYLEELSTLKATLEFDPIYENKEKNKALQDLKLDVPQLAENYLKIENEKNNLLQINKNIVDDLNRKLLFLENRVEFEEKERRKNKEGRAH